MTNNIYRVCVSDPATTVLLNGIPIGLPLINNFYYEIPVSSTPKLIEADKPIILAAGSNAMLVQGLKDSAAIGVGIAMGAGLFALFVHTMG